MKYRLLAVIPFAALLVLLIALAVVPEAHHALVYRVEIELAKIAGLVGSAAAAMRFGRGDYLRKAWWLQAQCFFFIFVNDVVFRPNMGGLLSHHSWAPLTGAILVFVANIGQLVGAFMIARVWRVAGFDLAGSAGVRRAVQIGAIVVALASAGYTTVLSVGAVRHGELSALVEVFSSVADIISFALIAPLLLTAIALRGGSLAWTWTLLTASLLGWLLFNAALSYGPLWVANPARLKGFVECARLLACMFGMAAGFAQRFALAGGPVPTALAAEPA